MTDITTVKQRFGIIGTFGTLDRALEVAVRVAPHRPDRPCHGRERRGQGVLSAGHPRLFGAQTQQIYSRQLRGDSRRYHRFELFGHEKSSPSPGRSKPARAISRRPTGGTIFLDEVAELPHPTQARLLRVLQTGEFIRVGSSKVQKTDVRVVAATNMNLQQAIASGRFREDLYYRLSTVPITVPSLRERPQDIPLLFRKFAADVAAQYRMPAVTLDAAARDADALLLAGQYPPAEKTWPSRSRPSNRPALSRPMLSRYLPPQDGGTPAPMGGMRADDTMSTERELLYKVLFDMRADINDLKRMMSELMHNPQAPCGPVHDVKALLPTTAQKFRLGLCPPRRSMPRARMSPTSRRAR